jgi:hypothetical protein
LPAIPHFVIVGAPKCGTTSLYRYLQQHPRVFMPENKEPRFFCDYPVASFEFGTKQFHPSIVTSPDEYLGLFCDAPPGAILGEASTDYLSRPGVAERLHAWNPDAKIIVMLRDPIARAYSEYQHSIAANFQTLSFAESLREEKRRFAEGYDPIFAHVRRSLYADGVEDFQQKFGQHNVKVILFEKFESATEAVVQSVFEFLALSPMQVDVSERYGSVKPQAAEAAQASRAINYLPIGEENRTGPRADLSRVEYESLRGEFINDVRRLASLLKIDLSRWLRDCDLSPDTDWLKQEPVNQVIKADAPYLGDSFLDRVRRSYQLTARDEAATKDSMWFTIGALKRPIHEALASKDNHALREIFSDPSRTDLYYGVDPIRVTGRPADDDLAGIEAWEKRHERMCRGLVLQLAEAIGIRRWLPDASELKPSYYPEGHVIDPDIDDVLSSIQTAIGFEFSFPNPFERESGVQTSRGLAAVRALNALYQTYRIRQELGGAERKSVIEIGPGMARTAYYSWVSGIRDYTTIDLPLGVAAQAWFLGAVLGPEALWMIGDDPALAQGRIRLLPSTIPLHLEAPVGLVLNADSITEMGELESARYATWIANHAEVFLSINHEANPPTIAALAHRFLSHAKVRRFPYWMRRGWIEEVFVFDRTSQTRIAVEQERDTLRREVTALRASSSWKMTAPLRAISSVFGRGSGRN